MQTELLRLTDPSKNSISWQLVTKGHYCYEGRSSFAIQYNVQMAQTKQLPIIFQFNLPVHQYTFDICQKVLLF